MPLTPNNREEHWLQGMVDGETTLTPNKRREYWYKEIIDAQGGGGGGGMKVTETDNTLSATMGDIMQAIDDCKPVYLLKTFDGNSDKALDGADTTRQLRISAYNGSAQDGFYCFVEIPLYTGVIALDAYYAASADDYPGLD